MAITVQLFQVRGNSRDKLGRHDEAYLDLQSAVGLAPNDQNALNSLAWHLVTKPEASPTECQEALGLIERAVALPGGRNVAALDTLALAYEKNELLEKAKETWREILVLDPENETAKEKLR